MTKCFFAVDLGATSGRTIIGSFTQEGLVTEEMNRFPNHIIETGGHFYWDIYELYRNILEGLKRAAAREDIEITSIGIDTWGVDFVCVGKDGSLLRQPYSYRDPHTEGAPGKYFERVPRSRVYELTGIQVMNFNSIFQLDTMLRHKDSALEAADKLLFIPDALSYMLTGEMVCEYTIASTAQLVNAKTRRLEPELLKSLMLDEDNFGRFVYPGETVGTLTEEVQRITGLGAVPVIAVAGHDTASAVAAVPAQNKNFAYLSSGTWSLMGVETDAPVINADTEALNFTNEGGVNGTIRLLKNICGMWLLERCRAGWGETSYPELIAEANASEPFRNLIAPPCGYGRSHQGVLHGTQAACHRDARANRALHLREPCPALPPGAGKPSDAFAQSDRSVARHRRRKPQRAAQPVDGKCHRHPRGCGPVGSYCRGQYHDSGAGCRKSYRHPADAPLREPGDSAQDLPAPAQRGMGRRLFAV